MIDNLNKYLDKGTYDWNLLFDKLAEKFERNPDFNDVVFDYFERAFKVRRRILAEEGEKE